MDINQTKKALAILKAIAFTENGGKPNSSKPRAGKTGEMKSVFQFEPATWKDYSKQVTGKDDTPLTPESEMAVAYQKVNEWLGHGYTPEQIFSTWNSGRPNAYKQNYKGVNKKYGVAYDTPGYVKKATNYLNQFENEAPKNPPQAEAVSMNQPNTSAGLIPNQQLSPTTQKGVL